MAGPLKSNIGQDGLKDDERIVVLFDALQHATDKPLVDSCGPSGSRGESDKMLLAPRIFAEGRI